MRNDEDSSGSEQSAGRFPKYVAGKFRKEEPRRASIGQSSLIARARAFDPNFNSSFDERKFQTITDASKRRSSWSVASLPAQKDPAYLFVSPTLTEPRRKSLQERILTNMKDEESLLLPRIKAPTTVPRLPKRNPVGPNMKALLDASNHRRISAVKPFQLPLTSATASKSFMVDHASQLKNHAFKLKKVCAPKLHVNPTEFRAPVHPKTEWQRALLHRAIKNNFMLKNNREKTEDALVDAMEKITVPKGGILATQGECSEKEDNYYVLEEGKVEFLKDNRRVKTAEAGESFGQERLLLRVPNETTVKAMAPSVLLRLNQTDYRSIMEQHVTKELENVEELARSLPLKVKKKKTIKRKAKSGKSIKKNRRKTKKAKKEPTVPGVFDVASLEKHSAEFKRQSAIRESVKKNAWDREDLEFISVLGEGQFGEVWLVAAHLPDADPNRQEFALKIQDKGDDENREDSVAEIRREIDVLKQIHHPFIVNLVYVYESEESIDMLLGLIPGGELWDQIHIEDENGDWHSGISEFRARFISYVLADTLAFLHSREFLFRDLKPENIMIDQDGYPVLVDFGFAKHVPNGSMTFTFCGTPNYVSPEVIRNAGQSVGVDHWALGVVIYEMLSGENPFFYDEMGQVELYEAIATEDPYDMPKGKDASSQAQDIIDELLMKDPKKRLGYSSSTSLLLHQWFKGMPDLDDIRAKKIVAPTDNSVVGPLMSKIDIDRSMQVEIDNVASFSEPQYVGTEHEVEEDLDIEAEAVGVEGELPLSPMKSYKEPTKWLITPTSKGKLRGYYVSPKTPFQKRTSEERRELLNKKMLDVISLDSEALDLCNDTALRSAHDDYRSPKESRVFKRGPLSPHSTWK